eukprot:TRINITY_DN58394_c0_g1_i1.p1 TRINITY_DN58394_c0_g1~~TRINITY_DN58394_c0_g1_i1.p1  ORF type:complete len:557 (-),score=81.68 TRINITY_DN58394_c0_g1_i1:666-2336(-)
MAASLLLDELCTPLLARRLPAPAAPVRAFQGRSSKRRAPPQPTRFHVVPKVGWDESLQDMGCGARNCLKKVGEDWLAEKPGRCWLLPASDEVAVTIAQRKGHLAGLGWKLLTCDVNVVLRLGNKALLRDFAEQQGLLETVPKHYKSPEEATYPCILKSATGEFGKGNHIVESEDEVLQIAGQGFGSQWVLQELVAGCFEYSVSLLVQNGEILECIGHSYECNREIYIWPHVRNAKVSLHQPSEAEFVVFKKYLVDYSGICNFNYKIRSSGVLSIFEMNVRVGGDLACDAPREVAATLFERLDSLQPTVSVDAVATPTNSNGHVNAQTTLWDEPLVIDPPGPAHRYTLVFLHPFRIGLRDYVRKMGLFSYDGLRVVIPHAPKRPISCYGGKVLPSWYDYLSDNRGQSEDAVGEESLKESRDYIFSLLDRECALLAQSEGGKGVLIGGSSQGCGMALDVALQYPSQLLGFVGIVGHPLSITPLLQHYDMPLHFFNGANDKVMRWQWVEGMIDNLHQQGYKRVIVHGPIPAVHHGVGREFEASCIHDVLRMLDGPASTS